MAMKCTVCVVRKKDADLYSAYRAEGQMNTWTWATLPADAPREEVELYTVETERTSLGVAPEWVPRADIDQWIRELGNVNRVR